MNKLLYTLFGSVFLLGFLQATTPFVPKYLTWVPDLLSIYCAAVVALRITVIKRRWIQNGYICFLFFYILLIGVGLFNNESAVGTVVIGTRIYFRYLPFFFLPFVYNLSERDFGKQLRFLFMLLVLQLPVAVSQKIYFRYIAHHWQTGDVVTGTILSSGVLSILLICSIAVLLAFHLKNYIDFKIFVAAALCMLFPTTINETKVTFFLLPFAFAIPVFIHKERNFSEKYRKIIKMLMVCGVCIVLFVPIYNMIRPQNAPSLLAYLENTDKLQGYLYHGEAAVKKGREAYRFDTILFAYKDLVKDWRRLLFGYGIGNVTSSSYWEASSKVYAERSRYKPESLGLTRLFWEVGLAGISLYLVFLWLVYRNARFLNRSWSVFGAFALGWCAVVPIMGIGLFYLDTVKNAVLGFCFWYFSGVVAAKAFQLKLFTEQKKLEADLLCYFQRTLVKYPGYRTMKVQ